MDSSGSGACGRSENHWSACSGEVKPTTTSTPVCRVASARKASALASSIVSSASNTSTRGRPPAPASSTRFSTCSACAGVKGDSGGFTCVKSSTASRSPGDSGSRSRVGARVVKRWLGTTLHSWQMTSVSAAYGSPARLRVPCAWPTTKPLPRARCTSSSAMVVRPDCRGPTTTSGSQRPSARPARRSLKAATVRSRPTVGTGRMGKGLRSSTTTTSPAGCVSTRSLTALAKADGSSTWPGPARPARSLEDFTTSSASGLSVRGVMRPPPSATRKTGASVGAPSSSTSMRSRSSWAASTARAWLPEPTKRKVKCFWSTSSSAPPQSMATSTASCNSAA